MLRFKKFVSEEMQLDESHFKVGQKVKCIHSGKEGVVTKVDPSEKGKYYTVKRDDGEVMQYAPDDLEALKEEADLVWESLDELDEITFHQGIGSGGDEVMKQLLKLLKKSGKAPDIQKRLERELKNTDKKEEVELDEASFNKTEKLPLTPAEKKIIGDTGVYKEKYKLDRTQSMYRASKTSYSMPFTGKEDLAKLKKLVSSLKEEVEQVQEELPDHLKKILDKKGNIDPKKVPRAKKSSAKVTDVTPKGYGPKEEVELDEADTYAIYKKGKVFDTFRSKEDAHDSLDSMGLSPISKKDYRVRKLPASHSNSWSMKEETELDEIHDRYMRAHGKKASGRGGWMFTTKRIGDVDMKNDKEFYQHPGQENLSKAAAAAKKALGTKNVYVMEETELDEAQWGVENTYMKYSPDELKVKKIKMMKSISNLKGQHSSMTALGGKNPRAEEIRELEGKIRMINQALQSKMKKESFELEEDRNQALKALEGLAKRGGMDKADFQKAHDLYKANKLNDLRKHIYRLDTDPSEAIADVINRHDSKAFNSMYPRAKSGDYIRSIVLDHGGK